MADFVQIASDYNSLWHSLYTRDRFKSDGQFTPYMLDPNLDAFLHTKISQLHEQIIRLVNGQDEAVVDDVLHMLHSTELEFAKKPAIAIVKKYTHKADAVFSHFAPFHQSVFMGVDMCRTLINSVHFTKRSELLHHIATHMNNLFTTIDLRKQDDQAYLNDLMVLVLRTPVLDVVPNVDVKINEGVLLYVAGAMFQFNKKYYDLTVLSICLRMDDKDDMYAHAIDHWMLYHDVVKVFIEVCAGPDTRRLWNKIDMNMIGELGNMMKKLRQTCQQKSRARDDGNVGNDEEQWLSVDKPRSMGNAHRNVIYGGAICAHFSFYTQRDHLDRTDILQQYKELAV